MATAQLHASEPERPNILWILIEDWSPDLSCYGTKGIHTPHVDKLASEGIRCRSGNRKRQARNAVLEPVKYHGVLARWEDESRAAIFMDATANCAEIVAAVDDSCRKTLTPTSHPWLRVFENCANVGKS